MTQRRIGTRMVKLDTDKISKKMMEMKLLEGT
jgi:hypothetical protein